MPRKRQGRTLGEDVYEHLRGEIVSGDRRPGERLHLSQIATQEDVSLSVVREAVTRLASEGLVETSPQRGSCVRTLSIADLEELTWLRVQVETLALRESISHRDVSWEAALVATHYTLAHTEVHLPEGPPNPAWMAAHAAFHAALAAAAQNGHLERLRQQLFDASELYRYWSDTLPATEGKVRSRSIETEHQAIFEAALSGDADLATSRLSEHLNETCRLLAEAGAATEVAAEVGSGD